MMMILTGVALGLSLGALAEAVINAKEIKKLKHLRREMDTVHNEINMLGFDLNSLKFLQEEVVKDQKKLTNDVHKAVENLKGAHRVIADQTAMLVAMGDQWSKAVETIEAQQKVLDSQIESEAAVCEAMQYMKPWMEEVNSQLADRAELKAQVEEVRKSLESVKTSMNITANILKAVSEGRPNAMKKKEPKKKEEKK